MLERISFSKGNREPGRDSVGKITKEAVTVYAEKPLENQKSTLWHHCIGCFKSFSMEEFGGRVDRAGLEPVSYVLRSGPRVPHGRVDADSKLLLDAAAGGGRAGGGGALGDLPREPPRTPEQRSRRMAELRNLRRWRCRGWG
ncbi:hypothetical protein CEXT_150221 [Caerostris extrusa]|uniref:Uncharacterized protein n=1 Tax=Caerostris extrusa TaxID=172846 RepID=A0AAV4TCY2_CAEEX|nr:hypothetical protein CEXT_150221 [Caerostris extrusa]